MIWFPRVLLKILESAVTGLISDIWAVLGEAQK